MKDSALVETSAALPLLIPLVTAVGCLFAGSRKRQQVAIGLGGAILDVAAGAWLLYRADSAGIVTTQIGGWPAPFGISFAVDRFGALMVLLVAIVVALGAVFSLPDLARRGHLSRFMPLLHLMLAGMGGFFVTADLFNLYVWFELTLVASFGLMVLDTGRRELEGATKYFAINILGSMFLLASIGILYAMAGTLNLADLSRTLEEVDRLPLTAAVAGMILVAFGIKSAAFPLFFWLPASYPVPPIGVTAIFGGVLTKVGVYGLVRVFTVLFPETQGFTSPVLLVAGGATMVAGVLGAIAQKEMRRLLAFLIISETGYLLIGLGFATGAGLAAIALFMIHLVISETALFFVCGIIEWERGNSRLDEGGGLYARRPAIAALFLVPALSLGGVPPLSGFIAKLSLIQAGIGAERYVLVGAAVLVNLLTLYAMAKIWTVAFWSPRAEAAEMERDSREPARPSSFLLWSPPVLLAALAIAAGLAAGPLSRFAGDVAHDLRDRAAYIDQVMGEPR